MPEVEHTTTIQIPSSAVWDFVEDIDNWAELVTGYQDHEVMDRDNSVWRLKGDVGVLARVVEIRVRVTEWREPDRVDFLIEGVTERVEGGGSFVLTDGPPPPEAGQDATAPRQGVLARIKDRILRFVLRLVTRTRPGPEAGRVDDGPGASRLTFRLRLDAGGPMAPMVNTLMGTMLGPAAREFADNLTRRLDERVQP